VIAQTAARIFDGDTMCPTRSSVFEPLPRGSARANAEAEFGNLTTIQEVEHQVITGDDVYSQRPADVSLWAAALDRHQTTFGRAPELAVGHRGFSFSSNERTATDRGVRRVVH
jgi:hypothetical protein